MTKPRILVTGASGFAGGHLVKYLHDKAYPVFAHNGRKSGNLTNTATMWGLPPDIDVLIHTAAVSTGPARSLVDNIQIAKNLLGWANGRGVRTIIFFSSVSLYGEVFGDLLAESSPRINPGVYGTTKHLCEELFQESAIPTASLRLPAIVGKGAARNFPARVRHGGKHGQQVQIFDKRRPYNNAVHIQFLCELVEKLIEVGWPGPLFCPILAASGDAMSIEEVTKLLVADTPYAKDTLVDGGRSPNQPYLIQVDRLASFLKPWPIERTIRQYIEDDA